MFKATEAIYNGLKGIHDDLLIDTEEQEGQSVVILPFSVENGPNYQILFISTDDQNDVAVRVFGLVHVDEDQKSKILPTLNDLNDEYRFVKFVCDSDGDVNVEYDITMDGTEPAEIARELLIRFTRIIDGAYPELMRALWA